MSEQYDEQPVQETAESVETPEQTVLTDETTGDTVAVPTEIATTEDPAEQAVQDEVAELDAEESESHRGDAPRAAETPREAPPRRATRWRSSAPPCARRRATGTSSTPTRAWRTG